MPGHAIFSNIQDTMYGKDGRTYDYHVKRFRTLLNKQKIIPTVQIGCIKNFTDSKIITEKEFRKIFQFAYNISDYDQHAEITIFTWE